MRFMFIRFIYDDWNRIFRRLGNGREGREVNRGRREERRGGKKGEN